MLRHSVWAACILLAVAAGAEVGYDPAWQVVGRGGFSAANQIVDPQSGATLGIVVCEVDAGVVCFDVAGNRVWEYPMAPPIFAAPAVGDVDADGREEIVAADGKGNLAVLADDGSLEWRVSGGVGIVEADSCPAIADLDGDGSAEILVGDTTGTLSCFGGGGDLRWQFTGDGTQMGPVLVADVYDVPGSEVFVTSHDRHIYALSAAGEWLWDIYCFNDLFPNSTPILADADGDETPELYVGGGLHHFYRIDLRTGAVAFEQNVYLHINGAIAATDLDGDGKDDVVFGNKGGQVWRYGADGFKWTYELRRSHLFAAPILADLDDDGALEILFHASSGDLQVFEPEGALAFSTMTPAQVVATPLAGDFDGDGMWELVSTSLTGGLQGDGTLVYAKLGAPFRDDTRNRTVFTGSRSHSGRRPGATAYPLLPTPARESVHSVHPVHDSQALPTQAHVEPAGDLTLLSGRNTWRFDVGNPEQERLLLLTTLAFPNGAVHRFARHILGPKERVALSFAVQGTGDYQATFELLDAAKRTCFASRDLSFRFDGFPSDFAYLTGTVFADTEKVLREWEKTNGQAARYFRGELTAMKGALAGLEAVPEPERTGALAALREEAERLAALAEAGAALAPTGSFFAWEFCPWAYFDAHDSLPTPDKRTTQLDASVLVGEYESLALNVTNVSSQALDVRVTCGDLDGPDAQPADKHVAFRRAVTVPTIGREQVADALPLLDQGGLLSVPALESQQLWITVNARGLAPGDYTAPVTLSSVEPEPTQVTIPIAIKVHDIALPRPSPLRFCVWSHDGGALGSDRPAVLEDLVAHGVNVFFGQAPKVTCDNEGSLTGPVDFEAHDASVARYAPHGLVMFIGAQGSVQGAPFLSGPWRKAYTAYLREWARHMETLGLTYADWALYPYDEPSTPYTETTINLVEVAKLTREADPNILIYTDPTSGTTMQSIDMLSGLIDIWCPSSELLERLGDEMVPVVKRIGKAVWFYDAAGRAKTLSTLGIYRWRFWYAWNQGFTGVGWWCYAYGDEQWQGWNTFGDFFCSVYPGAEGVVTSKRWEAAREGIEDYELLHLLREAVLAAEKNGASGAALDEARATLADVPREIEATLANAGRRLPLTPDSVPMYDETAALLRNARERLVEACLLLEAGKGPTR